MPRKRVTEIEATAIVEQFRTSKNLVELIKTCCNRATWFGRHGAGNRIMFQNAVIDELMLTGARVEFPEEPPDRTEKEFDVYFMHPYMKWEGVEAATEEAAIEKCKQGAYLTPEVSEGPFEWIAREAE